MEKIKSLSKTALICRYAICIALLVVCAQILVPLPFTAVPVTLATFMVFVIGGLLGPVHGAICMTVYMLMGLIGLPVFAGFNSFSALMGPTGGYIVGYIPMAAITGLFFVKFRNPGVLAIGMLLSIAVLYTFGALWYAYLMQISIWASLALTALPFIAADTIKMLLALFVIKRLNRALK